MSVKIDEPVSVNLVLGNPKWVLWHGRNYKIDKIGLHHTYRQGRTLYHVFSATAGSLFFRLVLNTDNLSWRLEEIFDELS